MKISQKIDVLFLTFCLLAVDVLSLNYGYPAPRSKYQSPPSAASPPLVSGSLPPNTESNRTAETEPQRKPNKSGNPYSFYYPLTFPQSRGGKNLNVSLVSESPREQARILNQPDLYPNFAVPNPNFNQVPSLNPSPPVRSYNNDDKGTPYMSKNPPSNPENAAFNPPPDNLSNKGSVFPPVSNQDPDVSNNNARQPKAVRYPVPPQSNRPIYVPADFGPQKNYKNTQFRYKFPSQYQTTTTTAAPATPKQQYQTTTSEGAPPTQQDTVQKWPCFCVPYYLCKSGVINSGGRSVAAFRRKGRSLLTYNFTNKTYAPSVVQPKVMSAYMVEQESDSPQCEGNKVCCRLSFAEEKDNAESYYPVATPMPEPYYPAPPRFPEKSKDYEQCGVRHAYAVQSRLNHVQYSADVSEFGEYPWQAAVLRKAEGQKSLYICGGVLISPQWVATAAHCVKKEQFSPLLIRLGEWDVNRKDELYPFIEVDVDSVVLYPDFNPDTLYNDVALIRMKNPVDTRLPHVTPACLPKRGTVYEQQKCWVSGWGKDFFGPQGEYQNVLKEVDVPVVARELCNSGLRNTNLGPDFTLHPGFLCAGGEPGKDACTGDGGSPLVCISGQRWYVVGLVSWGIGCGQPGMPGIYVNILYYIDWINSIIWR